MLPLIPEGEFAAMLEKGRSAALALYEKLRADARWLTCFPPELDIIVWAPRAAKASQISELSRRIFTEAGRRNLHLALATLPVRFFDMQSVGVERDVETITCLRSVLMKPEHAEWVDEIWKILEEARGSVLENMNSGANG
jgi:hypothetical protein